MRALLPGHGTAAVTDVQLRAPIPSAPATLSEVVATADSSGTVQVWSLRLDADVPAGMSQRLLATLVAPDDAAPTTQRVTCVRWHPTLPAALFIGRGSRIYCVDLNREGVPAAALGCASFGGDDTGAEADAADIDDVPPISFSLVDSDPAIMLDGMLADFDVLSTESTGHHSSWDAGDVLISTVTAPDSESTHASPESRADDEQEAHFVHLWMGAGPGSSFQWLTSIDAREPVHQARLARRATAGPSGGSGGSSYAVVYVPALRAAVGLVTLAVDPRSGKLAVAADSSSGGDDKEAATTSTDGGAEAAAAVHDHDARTSVLSLHGFIGSSPSMPHLAGPAPAHVVVSESRLSALVCLCDPTGTRIAVLQLVPPTSAGVWQFSRAFVFDAPAAVVSAVLSSSGLSNSNATLTMVTTTGVHMAVLPLDTLDPPVSGPSHSPRSPAVPSAAPAVPPHTPTSAAAAALLRSRLGVVTPGAAPPSPSPPPAPSVLPPLLSPSLLHTTPAHPSLLSGRAAATHDAAHEGGAAAQQASMQGTGGLETPPPPASALPPPPSPLTGRLVGAADGVVTNLSTDDARDETDGEELADLFGRRDGGRSAATAARPPSVSDLPTRPFGGAAVAHADGAGDSSVIATAVARSVSHVLPQALATLLETLDARAVARERAANNVQQEILRTLSSMITNDMPALCAAAVTAAVAQSHGDAARAAIVASIPPLLEASISASLERDATRVFERSLGSVPARVADAMAGVASSAFKSAFLETLVPAFERGASAIVDQIGAAVRAEASSASATAASARTDAAAAGAAVSAAADALTAVIPRLTAAGDAVAAAAEASARKDVTAVTVSAVTAALAPQFTDLLADVRGVLAEVRVLEKEVRALSASTAAALGKLDRVSDNHSEDRKASVALVAPSPPPPASSPAPASSRALQSSPERVDPPMLAAAAGATTSHVGSLLAAAGSSKKSKPVQAAAASPASPGAKLLAAVAAATTPGSSGQRSAPVASPVPVSRVVPPTVTSRPPSRAADVAPTASPQPAVDAASGTLQEIFDAALNAQDAGAVLALCASVGKRERPTAAVAGLSPISRMCLLQQLSAALAMLAGQHSSDDEEENEEGATDSATALEWLEAVATALYADRSPVTQSLVGEHLPGVVAGAASVLTEFSRSAPGGRDTRALRLGSFLTNNLRG